MAWGVHESISVALNRRRRNMTRTRWQRIKNSLFLIAGPIPISILIHLGLLLFIVIASQPRLVRDLINVELEAGGRCGR